MRTLRALALATADAAVLLPKWVRDTRPNSGHRRVRVANDQGFITVNGSGLMARREFEYQTPLADADQMLRTICIQPIIEKTRYETEVGGFVFEVDEFHGENAGLVVAEIELDDQRERHDRTEQEASNEPHATRTIEPSRDG
jgi:adenylate cyclase